MLWLDLGPPISVVEVRKRSTFGLKYRSWFAINTARDELISYQKYSFFVNTNTAENCPLVYLKTSSVDMLINAETPSWVRIFMIISIHNCPNNENSPQSSC